jgi:CBS-domain-containing membrane protein
MSGRPLSFTDRAILATLTAAERGAIVEAVPAWIGGAGWVGREVKPPGSRAGFPHETADEVLARCGVTFDADRRRFRVIVDEVQRRAYAQMGVDPGGGA